MSNSVLGWNVCHNLALYYKTTRENLLDHPWQNKVWNFAVLKSKKILLAENHWFLQTGFNCVILFFFIFKSLLWDPCTHLHPFLTKFLRLNPRLVWVARPPKATTMPVMMALLPPKKHNISWTFKSHCIHFHPDHLFLPPTKLRYKSILHSIHTYPVQ